MLWYLSYASDDGFLGAVITRGATFLEACSRAKALCISPGGEVMGLPIPDDDPQAMEDIKAWGIDRLISEAELVSRGARPSGEIQELVPGLPGVDILPEDGTTPQAHGT